jgi:hypothetical protein
MNLGGRLAIRPSKKSGLLGTKIRFVGVLRPGFETRG